MAKTPDILKDKQLGISRRRAALIALVMGLAAAFFFTLHVFSAREHARIASIQAANQAEKMAQESALRAAREATSAAIKTQLVAGVHSESQNRTQLALVSRVGGLIISKNAGEKSVASLRFHLLAEPNSINLYALPGGDVYLTTALLNRMQTEGQLAAVLAHGAAHVLAGDVPSERTMVNHAGPLWAYTTAQEHAADVQAVTLMANAGYDPNAMIGMFTVLLSAYTSKADVAFFATHPNEDNRLQHIDAAIRVRYPSGIPAVLSR